MGRHGGLKFARVRNAAAGLAIASCLACAVGTASAASAAHGAAPKTSTEEFMIPSVDPGALLYVRNKRPQAVKKFAPDKILLFVHGATYPAESAFDLKLNGLSWMDYIAEHGYDVYLVDLRGYGKSTRPPQMSQPAADNPPIERTESAVKDVGAAVDFILKRRGVPKIDLLGWSWGTEIMGWYTAQNNDKVNRLVLYAPIWIATSPPAISPGGKLGAYRSITREAAKSRWLKGVPEDKTAELIPAGWFEAWWDATSASDPEGARQAPPVVRAPNGVVQDIGEFWAAGGEGTHHVMLEKNRMQLFQEVQQFLDGSLKSGE
jgi:pimeloyl-ACP methyl ester carboxylesterase